MADRIDLRPLLGWTIPDVEQRYDHRDTAFYALSVGVGHDALSAPSMALVDPWNASLQALPTLALVLGYPGFWLGRQDVERATGLTPSRILHVDQTIALNDALPPAGHLIGRSRVVGLIDKGEGGDALLYSERRLVQADTGEAIATLRQTHLLRGAGGFGGGIASWPPDFIAAPRRPSPSGPPDKRYACTTRPEQALLYRLNGDANPLHFDLATARAAGLERPILHGMATLGVACHAITAAVLNGRPARLRGLSARMSAIVHPGETLRTDIWPDRGFRTVVVERNAVVLDAGCFQCVA